MKGELRVPSSNFRWFSVYQELCARRHCLDTLFVVSQEFWDPKSTCFAIFQFIMDNSVDSTNAYITNYSNFTHIYPSIFFRPNKRVNSVVRHCIWHVHWKAIILKITHDSNHSSKPVSIDLLIKVCTVHSNFPVLFSKNNY